jgi:hypothetical protein
MLKAEEGLFFSGLGQCPTSSGASDWFSRLGRWRFKVSGSKFKVPGQEFLQEQTEGTEAAGRSQETGVRFSTVEIFLAAKRRLIPLDTAMGLWSVIRI